MADYGTDVGVPNNAGPGQLAPPAGTPQPAPTPPPDQGHPFNEEALGSAFDKIPSQTQGPAGSQNPGQGAPQFDDQGKQTPAAGNFSQIAQANIGRNVSERLQIWSKMVGDNNAVVGPNSDVWIRGQDNKFHPADSDHTNMIQDIAKKSGAGIDVVAMGLTDLAAMAGGAGAGALAGGPGGAAVGAKVGYIAGLCAGPAAGSAGRQFLESRVYGIQPDKEQFKRDALIGCATNVFMGGIFSGMGIGPQIAKTGIVGSALDKIGSNAAESASQRSIRLARAQEAGGQFFDAVGADPKPMISDSGEINTGMSQAGDQIKGAVDAKRQGLNSAIEDARTIIVSSPGKPNALPLAQGIKQKLVDEGVRFDEHSMPISPDTAIPINATPVGVNAPIQIGATTQRSVSQMSPAVDQLMDDYKACVSGQMDKDSYLDMVKRWQADSQFKVFETRPDAEVASWRQLQRMGVEHRNNMIADALQSSPDDLAKVQKAYGDYRATTDALDLVDQQFKQAKNSPEILAQSFFQPGQKELLTQFQSAFKDNPSLIRNTRAAWLSQKMGNYMSQDGVFNSPGFLKELQGMGGETLSQLFNPTELASLKRSASIMGSIKTSDLTSQAQGDSVTQAVGDLATASRTNTQALLKWFQDKPKFADYVTRAGSMEKLASQTVAEDPTYANGFIGALRNWTVGTKVLSGAPKASELAGSSVPFNLRQIGTAAITNSKVANIVGNVAGKAGAPVPVITNPSQGTTGSQAGFDNASAGQ
jgi:hypothetical protein